MKSHSTFAAQLGLRTIRRLAQRRGFCICGALLLVLTFGGGCLSKPPLAKQSFAFPLPPPATNITATIGRRLELRQISVAAPFDSLSFTYRTGLYSYERDPYAQFLVSPEECFRPLLCSYLRDSGLFREVTDRDTLLPPDGVAEVRITELYGDFRNQSIPLAVLRMSFVILEKRRSGAGEPLLQKEYLQRVPFHSRTATALAGAWNQALQRIMAAVSADLEHALASSAPKGGS